MSATMSADGGPLARVSQLLMAIIDYSLDHYFYRNAIFWSERLVALDTTSPYFVFYRALSLYRAGQPGRAYDALVHAPPFYALPAPPAPPSQQLETATPTSSSRATVHPSGRTEESSGLDARASTSQETSKISRMLHGVNTTPSCQYLLARCCFDLGAIAEGIDAAKRAVELLPVPRVKENEVMTDDAVAWTRNDLFSKEAIAEMGCLHPAELERLPAGIQATFQSMASFLRHFASGNAAALAPYLHSSPQVRHSVDQSAALAMLGLLQRESDTAQQASIDHLSLALQQNPFLFNAMEALLQQGYEGNLEQFFPRTPDGLTDFTTTTSPVEKVPTKKAPRPASRPMSPKDIPKRTVAKENEAAMSNANDMVSLEETPISASMIHKRAHRHLKDASARKRQRSDDTAHRAADTEEEEEEEDITRETNDVPMEEEPSSSLTHRLVHGADQPVAWAAHLMRVVSMGLQHSNQFRAEQASKVLRTLSPSQYETAWVHATLGTTFAECQKWGKAVKHFEKARQLDPLLQEHMDIFSTALWQTGNKVALSHLSHELIEANRRSPFAWVALGNAFSLQKEHETALKCFQRAVQLDPTYAYAYSLAGHEHLANDDYQKSLATFRNAIKWNSRLYNAWYGLALVYSQQEKLDMAEYHYTQAVRINRNSATLFQNLAGICAKLKKYDKAIDMYDLAIHYSPEPTHAMYRKAKVFMDLSRYTEARQLLEQVKQKAPNDAKVFETLGEVYEKVGMKTEAIDAYMVAAGKVQKEKPKLMDRIRRLQLTSYDGLEEDGNVSDIEDTMMWQQERRDTV